MKICKKTSLFLVVLGAIFLMKVGLVSAQAPVTEIPGEGSDLIDWILELLRYVIGLGGIVAAAVLIGNGFIYMTAGGDEGKIEKATKGITFAIVGLVIAAIAFLIVNFVVTNVIN